MSPTRHKERHDKSPWILSKWRIVLSALSGDASDTTVISVNFLHVVCDTSFRFLVIRKQKVVMSRFDKYAASISESIIQMTFMDEIKREKIVFLCVWFFLLEQQFLNTYSYYIICPHVEDTGGLSNYQTHRQRRRDIIHACTKVKYGRRKKNEITNIKNVIYGGEEGCLLWHLEFQVSSAILNMSIYRLFIVSALSDQMEIRVQHMLCHVITGVITSTGNQLQQILKNNKVYS